MFRISGAVRGQGTSEDRELLLLQSTGKTSPVNFNSTHLHRVSTNRYSGPWSSSRTPKSKRLLEIPSLPLPSHVRVPATLFQLRGPPFPQPGSGETTIVMQDHREDDLCVKDLNRGWSAGGSVPGFAVWGLLLRPPGSGPAGWTHGTPAAVTPSRAVRPERRRQPRREQSRGSWKTEY